MQRLQFSTESVGVSVDNGMEDSGYPIELLKKESVPCLKLFARRI